MTIEALWCSSYIDGEPPRCRRLSRLPLADQWRAAIDLAIAFVRGEAGYRKTHVTLTRESYWYWRAEGYAQRSATANRSDWWLVPMRVELRALRLADLAAQCAARMGRGRCDSASIAAVLERWRRTGHWQRLAVGVCGDKREPAKRTVADSERDERIRDIQAQALRRRYPLRVAETEEHVVWARPDADCEVIAGVVSAAMDDGGCLTDRDIDHIAAAGGLVEAICTT